MDLNFLLRFIDNESSPIDDAAVRRMVQSFSFRAHANIITVCVYAFDPNAPNEAMPLVLNNGTQKTNFNGTSFNSTAVGITLGSVATGLNI
jgi:hypothetical protein